MVARRANAVLRSALAEFGLTQEELAEQVNQKSEELFGKRTNCTDVHVRRWISGRVQWPWPCYLIPLEEIFGRSAVELGFTPRGRDSLAALARVREISVRGQPGTGSGAARGTVRRREFFQAVGGTVLASSLIPATGRLGMTDVARIQRIIDDLDAADDLRGSAGLVQGSEACIGQVRASMASCVYSVRVEKALHATLGTLFANAGWFAFDCGDHATAERYYDESLRCALLADDRLLQARAWSTISMQARRLGRYRDAVTVARTALDSVRGRDRMLSSLLWMRAATGHAEAGDSRQAYRAVENAETALHKSTRRDPSWLDFYGPAEFMGLKAAVDQSLGRSVDAQNATRQALDLMPGRYGRNRSYYLVQLAGCYLDGRDVEQAVATAYRAVETVPGLRSARVHSYLQEFCGRLSDFGGARAAEEFREFASSRIGVRKSGES